MYVSVEYTIYIVGSAVQHCVFNGLAVLTSGLFLVLNYIENDNKRTKIHYNLTLIATRHLIG